MTRLKNAQKQLSEALVALESAADQKSVTASFFQTSYQTHASSDVSALFNEVSLIETMLSEAITTIATIKGAEIRDGDTE